MKELTIARFNIDRYEDCEYIRPEAEFEPGKVVLQTGETVIKAILTGTVVDSFMSDNLGKITIDDFSGIADILAFNENKDKLGSFEVGDTVWVVGKPKTNEDGLFFVLDSIKKINFNEEILSRSMALEFLSKNKSPSKNSKKKKEKKEEETEFTSADKFEVNIEKETI